MSERYRLVRAMASGGMAELFLGLARGAEGFEKHVAIKRILPHLARDEGIARMFVSEARLATHLQHQNLVSVYDVGNDATGLFLVMELVNGWDLGVLLRRAKRQGQRFPPHLVAFIGAQALAGLIHAYRRTHNGRPLLTAHRDISPSNILVSREGEVKVTDFGIARLEGVSHGTQPGVFKGKPSYAAPEVVTGAPATAASDQFSLGIVLYELLTGQHPFSSATEAIVVAMAIVNQEPPPLTGVPEPLAEVVLRALAKSPEARFPQPEAMAEALAHYLSRAGEPATSHTLARFISGLSLPPTLLEQAEAAAREGEPQAALPPSLEPTRTSVRSGETTGWVPASDAPALSMSGRLVTPSSRSANLASAQPGAHPQPPRESPSSFRCVRCDSPLPSAYAPCDRCAAELTTQGPAPLAATASVLNTPAEALELEQRGPREETLWAPERRAPWGRWALRLAVVAALVAGGLWARPYLEPLLPHAERLVREAVGRPRAAPAPLIIHSQPGGARVRVDGVERGTTPLMMENDFAQGVELPVEVSLPGYKPWKGTFTGSAPAHFEVRLQKR